MVKYNSTILLVIAIIGLAVLLSGCTGGQDAKINTGEQQNINVSVTTSNPIKIPTPAKQTEILNVDIRNIILSDSEIREFLGNKWNTSYNPISGKMNDISYNSIGYSKSSTVYTQSDAFVTWMFIYPNLNSAKDAYSRILIDGKISIEKEKNPLQIIKLSKDSIMTDINFGDSAKYIVIQQDVNNRANYHIIFIRNNIIAYLGTNSKSDIDNLTSLAKKQDEKISRILDMIK